MRLLCGGSFATTYAETKFIAELSQVAIHNWLYFIYKSVFSETEDLGGNVVAVTCRHIIYTVLCHLSQSLS